MNVIILCAGIGSRLKPITDTIPKCLLPIAGSTLVERLISQILKYSLHPNISVVIGHKFHEVNKVLENYNAKVVINEDYLSTNNMYSFLLASENVVDNSDVIIINGDCIYDDKIIEFVISNKGSYVMADPSLFSSEAMKIKFNEPYVYEFSKNIENSESSYVSMDIYRYERNVFDALKRIAKEFIESGNLNMWNEEAMNMYVERNKNSVKYFLTPSNKWYEIDNMTDYINAKNIFGV
jgi:choline kinase